jgi:hypothetical protein
MKEQIKKYARKHIKGGCYLKVTQGHRGLRHSSVQELSTRIAFGMPTTVPVRGLNEKIVTINKPHTFVNMQHCWQLYITFTQSAGLSNFSFYNSIPKVLAVHLNCEISFSGMLAKKSLKPPGLDVFDLDQADSFTLIRYTRHAYVDDEEEADADLEGPSLVTSQVWCPSTDTHT